jgi:MraZ protein
VGQSGGKWSEVEEVSEEYGFSGTFEHVLDDKGRLTIPSSFRSSFADGAVLRKGNADGSIEILPRSSWNLFLKKLKDISKTDVRGQRWVTLQLASAATVELDKAGRVLLGGELRAFADLVSGPVVVTGALDRLKVWEPKRWAAMETEGMEELDDYVYEKYQI